MPRYSFQCSNPDCHHVFEATYPAQVHESLQFCPVCDSVSERAFSDFTSVRTMKSRQFFEIPKELHEVQSIVQKHVHGPGCGCVLNQTGHYVAPHSDDSIEA
jgi:hypothetical protein